MPSDTAALPEYAQPPVVEVVCGTAFEPVPNLTVPHLGLFWQRLGAEYTRCVEAPPLATLEEQFDVDGGAVAGVELPGVLPAPRVWFVHRDDSRIVQVQRERFLCNWRKTHADHQYPRYQNVISSFDAQLQLFHDFVGEYAHIPLVHRQYELTYINHISDGLPWRSLEDIGAALPDFAWRRQKRFLPAAELCDLRLAFRLPRDVGRVHMRVNNAFRKADRHPLLVLELTARGFHTSRRDWFDIAHDFIVRTFADLTSSQLQQEVWRRSR